IPLAALNLLCVVVVKQFALSEAWLLPASLAMFVGAAIVSAQAAKRRVSRLLRRPAAAQAGG
ncbi:MAG TPA: hypothetical protein PLF81_27425, partial [Candidatus Anammoximicrobium sp.]|nr:hypothetical protein [Candidatus Anammoximicrobium sp.]